MQVTCPDCGKVYDDARRWTICPHFDLGMTVEPGAITKILQERNPEGYPQGFSLGVTHGRQTLQLLLTDAEHPETEVIAQISITEVVEYLKLRMEAQSQQALHLLAKLETYKEKP